MDNENPIFEIYITGTGKRGMKHIKIWRTGKVEGFADTDTVAIINRIPLFEREGTKSLEEMQ